MLEETIVLIPVDEIKNSDIAIRSCDTESAKIKEMGKSLLQTGQLSPIRVREKLDPATGEATLELVDGLQRLSAAKDIGWTEIQAINCGPMENIDALAMQLTANHQRIDMQPAALGKQFHRMLAEDPELTVPALAQLVSMSTQTVKDRMKISKALSEEAQILVDEGRIPLLVAKHLAKLPMDMQADYFEDIMREANKAPVIESIQAKVKEVNKALATGKKPGAAVFEPKARFRKRADIEAEIENPVSVREFCESDAEVIGAIKGLQYCLQLDELTVMAEQEKFDLKQEEKKRQKKEREMAKEKKKQKETEERLAELAGEE